MTQHIPPVPNILIVDNDEDVVRGLSRRLESLGYRCQTARTGAQGLAEFSLGDIDLVITDLNMPVLDGVALVGKIRQSSDVPIIIITGFREEFTQHLKSLQDIVILRKPFDSQQLVDLVTTELALSRRRAG